MIFRRKYDAQRLVAQDDQNDPATAGDPDSAPVEPGSVDVGDGRDATRSDIRDEEPDWRADGPFDIDEVDLAADGVTRLDLGSLIITPWTGLQIELRVDNASQQLQSVLVGWQGSALEVAAFAAPAEPGLRDQVLLEMEAEARNGQATLTRERGPFGPELRRTVPVKSPDGKTRYSVSRLWFVEGPRWLLRGTLMGAAAIRKDDDPVVASFTEFFRNIVVSRGEAPMLPGALIPMKMPRQIAE